MRTVLAVADPFVSAHALEAGLDDAGIEAEVLVSATIPAERGIEALLVGPETAVTAEQLAALPDLRHLIATSAGTDHLPVDEARRRGIWVTRAVDYCTDEVAEHTIAAICLLLRGIPQLDSAVRSGAWESSGRPPVRISGTVLGLYGYGRTARAVAQRARALGMAVLAHCRDSLEADGVRIVTREELLTGSDVLSLHVPLTEDTAGLIDASTLSVMRPGAYLVNAARGGLLDEQAVADALHSGRLAGAALDVLSDEPPAATNPLLTAPNTVITPHVAWYSADSVAQLVSQSVAAIVDVLNGCVPAGAVSVPGQRR